MAFQMMFAKLRAPLAEHGLLLPARLAALHKADLPELITMAMPEEDLDPDVKKDLIL